MLVLRSAMNASFKLKCYATSATFCRRMLELPLQPKAPALARRSRSTPEPQIVNPRPLILEGRLC